MRNIHIVSHTHWDREWYRSFQSFRLKLVHLVDGLLDLLEKDPHFKYFMLDGQTIVLDDYLAMRPEKEVLLRKHIQKGRIVIGSCQICFWSARNPTSGTCWRATGPPVDSDRK